MAELHAEPSVRENPPASTTDSPAALGRAQAAWDRGEFDVAERLYSEAIDHGGLQLGQLLDACVRVGSARAILGKKDRALAAFRRAALIDRAFVVPAEAGRKATQLADAARKELGKAGSIALHVKAPETLRIGEGAIVEVNLDPAHAAVVRRLAFEARLATTASSATVQQAAEPHVSFPIPARLALSGATLVVRVDALDEHDNRLASVERKLHVTEATTVPVGPVATAEKPADPAKPGRSFWSTPWPYVVGGVALAAGAAAAYFVTRPPDEAFVGSPRVQTR